MDGRKSVLSIGMARGEFGELTRGEVTRFHCTCYAIFCPYGLKISAAAHYFHGWKKHAFITEYLRRQSFVIF